MTMINSILSKFNLRLVKNYPRGFQKFALRGKKNLVGAEVGVYRGDHALSLLKKSNIAKLYLIDAYKISGDYQFYGNTKLDDAKKSAFNKLRSYPVAFIYRNSEDALEIIPKNLDFVYIDANHRYGFVKNDIERYWNCIKEGGILGGHDVSNVGMEESPNSVAKQEENPCGVIKAAAEFAIRNGLKIHIYGDDWWVIKGDKEKWNLGKK